VGTRASSSTLKHITGDKAFDQLWLAAGICLDDFRAIRQVARDMLASKLKGGKPDLATRERGARLLVDVLHLSPNRPRFIVPIQPDEGTRERILAELPESVLLDAIRGTDGNSRPKAASANAD